MELNKVLSMLLFFLIFFMSGCWDKTEIDDRAFVLGLVVDKTANAQTNPSEAGKNNEQASDIDVTLFSPIPSKLSSGVDAFTTEKSKGKNITDALDNLKLNFDREIFLGQIKVILIGEKILKDPENFKKLLDFIERDPDMGRSALVAAVKDGTDKLQNIKPKFEKVFGEYMLGIFNNAANISDQLSLPLNSLLGSIRDNKGNAVMPVISVEKDKAICDDLVFIKDYKYLKYMDKKYLRPFSIITNKQNDGDLQIPYNNKLVSIKITRCETKKSLINVDRDPTYKIGVKLEGDIDNFSFDQDVFVDDELNNIRHKGEAIIKKEMQEMINYFQNDIMQDYLDIGDYTDKYNHKFYQTHSDNWNDEFRKVKFDYDINLYIRRVGGTKK